ncbi:uncharacterized protein [Ambystoma mexicanum]|uniref:uncharacterized protein n=1 Tax=Ambystoma mexicanum TaxID=8296 RepID=UPI0037E90CF4
MKTRKELFPEEPEEVTLTFCDVAACFSEEEWMLLHQWQKELYKNVMKQIQQAFSSLGPLIATTVFSLKPKEKEAVRLKDAKDVDIDSGFNPSSRGPMSGPNVLLRENQCLKDTPLTERKERRDSSNTGEKAAETDVLLEVNPYRKDMREVTGKERRDHPPSAGPCLERTVSVHGRGRQTSHDAGGWGTKEPQYISHCGDQSLTPGTTLRMHAERELGLANRRCPERGESSTGLAPEFPVITSVFSLSIKPEEGVRPPEQMQPERRVPEYGVNNFRHYPKQQHNQMHQGFQHRHRQTYESGAPSTAMHEVEEEPDPCIAVDEEEYQPPKKKYHRLGPAPGPAPVPSARSWTWRYFVMPEGQTLRNAHVVNCRLCCKPVKRGIPKENSSLGTSCLAMHLRRNHNITEESECSSLLPNPPLSAERETVAQPEAGTSAGPGPLCRWP